MLLTIVSQIFVNASESVRQDMYLVLPHTSFNSTLDENFKSFI